MFPRVCSSCSSHLPSGGEQCPACRVTVWCSDLCRLEDTQHGLHCENLAINLEDYLYSRTRSGCEQADHWDLEQLSRLER